MKNSIAGLIHAARDLEKYAEFVVSGLKFSASEKNGRVSIRVDGALRSRKAAEAALSQAYETEQSK